MTVPIGLQLYSVREEMKQDFEGTVTRVAEMGYVGVETAGFPEGVTAADAKKLFDKLGLQVISAHSALPLGDKKNEVLDNLAALGCQYLVCPWLSPDYYSALDQVKGAADQLNEAAAVATENGLTLLYHNHHFEFLTVGGEIAFHKLLELVDPAVKFEIDTYWVKVGGPDPVAIITQLGDRAPLLHIKDGPGNREEPMLAVGEGIMDFHEVIKAGEGHTEWQIVELDRCGTDMMEAVEKSYQYLVGEGLARGK